MPVNDEIPESRIMLTYRTTVDGEPRDVDLPFRLLVLIAATLLAACAAKPGKGGCPLTSTC